MILFHAILGSRLCWYIFLGGHVESTWLIALFRNNHQSWVGLTSQEFPDLSPTFTSKDERWKSDPIDCWPGMLVRDSLQMRKQLRLTERRKYGAHLVCMEICGNLVIMSVTLRHKTCEGDTIIAWCTLDKSWMKKKSHCYVSLGREAACCS